ncbi:hypothetical protein [Thermococcus barophilus]|uniref:Uncharacterized protein n=1 Tax=Thermococcus barophilus TaxID=55802 RepID=A0A0S1XF86_THEBA|nr:hypothetical protein [Thermococcus barophilus]ALM76463.1 hypothetical protein TBCH5v1_2574 [Thermococcus barophilus]
MAYVKLIKFRGHDFSEKARRKIALEKPKVESVKPADKGERKLELWQRLFGSGIILLLLALTLLLAKKYIDSKRR